MTATHIHSAADGAAAADGVPAPSHLATECPECFREQDHQWWRARPTGARLVGVVVTRDGMPSVVEQREQLARFGVPIHGFRHPAPETLETWEQRLTRLFGSLAAGDVVVVTSVHALGRDIEEETRTVAELRRRGVVVKVLGHGGTHLFDAGR